jgi:pimeloyl-ACP methyl ester carboxylesterase
MPGLICAGVLACILAGTRPSDPIQLLALGGNTSTGQVRLLSGPFDPGRPTLVVIHGINPVPRLLHYTLAERYAEAVGPACNVLSWDWNAATLPSYRPSVVDRAAVAQGQSLAWSLSALGVEPSRLHLIGQSTGSVVATSCARSLCLSTGRQVAQLTLLDPSSSQHPLIFGELAASRCCLVLENLFAPSPSGFGQLAPYPGVHNYSAPTPSRWRGYLRPSHIDHMNVVRWHLRRFPL